MTAMASQSIAIIAGILLAGQASSQQRAPNRPQLSQLQGWGKTFAYQQQQLASKPADVVFVGDSLTECWASTGKAVWQLEFHKFRAINFGIAGDRTENILFRVTRVNLAAHAPRMFVLLAGTNNLSREPPDSPEETVLAIKTIVDYLAKQCPESKVILLTLPPNGYEPDSPLRKRVIETNRRLKELIVPEQVELIDIYPVFADDAHRWKRGMTIDGTHFSQQGYDYLARALKPAIDTLRPEPKAQHRD
jgi:lysophospholipase L1-like esterase